MQNNYHFLRHLVPALDRRFTGSVISECFSQERDELVIRLEAARGSAHFRANLSPSFTCLSLPRDFQRARKNSIALFSPLVGRHITGILLYENDRSFSWILTDGLMLVFKLHGNRSNAILFEKEKVIELFRKNIDADYRLEPSGLGRKIDYTYEAFIAHQDNLPSLYFTFGKIPWRYLNARGFGEHSLDERWSDLQALLQTLENPVFYITRMEGRLFFSLLPVGELEQQFNDPVTALNTFHQLYLSRAGFDQEMERLNNLLAKRVQQLGDSIDRAGARLEEIQTEDKFRVWADLLMANLHRVPDGDRIEVENFYEGNKPETIRIRKDQTLQKNAATYYAKSKKQQLEIAHLESLIAQKQRELDGMNNDLAELAKTEDIKALRSFAARHPVRSGMDDAESLPYHETTFMGFRILIGRNAQANDILLRRFGYKDDLWLHAKDVRGSHVLIKHQAGKAIPRAVIERAGQLAAWHSKRKTDTLCPVIVTPRKYVRRRKGDPAGTVVVERETVILVKPLN